MTILDFMIMIYIYVYKLDDDVLNNTCHTLLWKLGQTDTHFYDSVIPANLIKISNQSFSSFAK